jgi:tetratricopeptide (TPR) repeat protein
MYIKATARTGWAWVLAAALAAVPAGCGVFRGKEETRPETRKVAVPERPLTRAERRAAAAAAEAARRTAEAPPPAITIARAPETRPTEAATIATPGMDAFNRGRIAEEKGDWEEALRQFERAIERNPRLTIAYLKAGDIYRRQGDYGSAEARYRAAADLEPRNFEAQYLHALSLQLLGRTTEAVRGYLRALSIKPDDFEANLNLATAYLQLNEPEQGIPYAERAVRLNPRSAAARSNLGAIFAALDRHEEAVIEYQQAAELTPLTPPLLLNLAESLGRTGRHAEMANVLRQALQLEPSAVAWERLGYAQFKLRQYAQAEASFRAAIEIDPNHYPALNGIGVCKLNEYLFSNRSDEAARQEALRMIRRSLQIERNQPAMLELLTRFN